MELRGRTILITGAGGFVGPYLARALKSEGARVVGLGIEPPPAGGDLDGWHAGDLRNAAALREVVAAIRPDAVVHLAGQSSASRSFEQPVETFEINVLGTWNLLEAVRCEAPDARVVVVTSGEIYGSLEPGTRATESSPFQPVSPYALSKAAADALSAAFGRAHRVDIIRVRSFSHTGPGQDPRFVLPSFARQIATIEAGRSEPVLKVGNLEVVRDVSDVRDVAAAYVLLLQRGRGGEAYNVCRGEGVRLSELAGRLVARARVPIRVEVDTARLRPSDVPYLVGDPGAIRRDTGWQADIPLDRTLDDLLEEWRRKPAAVV